MAEQIFEQILNLKNEVLRWASPIGHTHNMENIDGLIETIDEKAPVNHAYATGKYGEATNNQYGHVKVLYEILGESDNVPTEKAVKQYIDMRTANLDPSSLNIPTNDDIRNLATTVFNNNFTDAKFNAKLLQKSAIYPKDTTSSPNSITDSGYYRLTGTGNITYGNDVFSYHNAFLRVTFNGTRYIQHLQLSNSEEYERVRYKKSDGNWTWGYWHLHYKPYTENASAVKKADSTNNEYQNIHLYETTAGYIVRWQRDGKFRLQVNQYEYDKICSFSPALNITGPYVFGNLVGRSDVRINANGMWIRSTDQKGQYISGINETFFIPRKQ